MKIKEKTKSIPLRFNEQSLDRIKDVADLLGISGCYGEVSKVLKFSLAVTLAALNHPEKLYIGLNEAEHNQYLTSQMKLQKRLKLMDEAEKLKKKAENV